jgi:hypothetical protein
LRAGVDALSGAAERLITSTQTSSLAWRAPATPLADLSHSGSSSAFSLVVSAGSFWIRRLHAVTNSFATAALAALLPAGFVVEAPTPVLVDAAPGPEVLVVEPPAVGSVVGVEPLLLLELPQPATSAAATSAGISHGKRCMIFLLRPLGSLASPRSVSAIDRQAYPGSPAGCARSADALAVDREADRGADRRDDPEAQDDLRL